MNAKTKALGKDRMTAKDRVPKGQAMKAKVGRVKNAFSKVLEVAKADKDLKDTRLYKGER